MSTESTGRSFADLGEPIQRLLQQIQRNLSDEELDMFAKVTVRQLAKVYDMLALEEDPEKILAWLKKEHMKSKGIDPEVINEKRRKRVVSEGGRDPIAYFKELERKNMEFMDSIRSSQQEREAKREANIAERRRRREECMRRKAEEKTSNKPTGESDDVKNMKPEEITDILGVFERFTSKQSTFDNSNSVQDSEWWKRDEYRRDYEKNGVKGSAWTSVVEGGSLRAPEAEIQVREEWYRVQCWWKSDVYSRNWLALRDAEWWKEEPYITDWLDNGDDGTMWNAADELTGYNHRGNRRKAPKAELERRIQWYKVNGPKGIVKTWCAMTEGSKDHCTVEEKYERDDYYKNGDWWKSEIYVNNVRDKPAECSALHFASASAMDQEWWKQPAIRADYTKGGILWKAIGEDVAVRGLKDFASENELSRRDAWFKTFWWKGEEGIKDYEQNGSAGKVWRASESGSTSMADAVQLRTREEWFLGCHETEWWKSARCIRDWLDNGDKGTLWTAAWRSASLEADGKNKASDTVLKERVQYFKENFWKQDKYIKDYIAFNEKGLLWKSNHPDAAKDLDWWKSRAYFSQWVLSNHAFPSEFWKHPEVISDYWTNGAAGKKWTAANGISASLEKGDIDQASPEELAVRESYYMKYWWRQVEYRNDFCAGGVKWTAETPEGTGKCSAQEVMERECFYEPLYLNRCVLGYQRLLELDATAPATGLFATYEERCYREHYYQTNWWKTPDGLADYAFKGSNSIYISAATFNDARALIGAQSASTVDSSLRMLYFDSGAVEYSADNEYAAEFLASVDWWQDPLIVSDFLQNGDHGKQWKANNAASGFCKLADKDTCGLEEQKHRKNFYNKNFWISQECLDDFCQNGMKGKLWTASEPRGKGKRVDEKRLLLRAQILTGYPEDTWRKEMEANWWKSPEVRADYTANGETGQLFSAVNAYSAIERLGGKSNYTADASEIRSRVEYYNSHPLITDDAEISHFFSLIEPFWLSPESVEDFFVNGSAGTKWTASNAAAFSCSLGNKYQATPTELQRREENLHTLFWRAPTHKLDFLSNGKNGQLWNKSEFDGSGEAVGHEEELVRICYYLRPSEKYFADCRYASKNWWKAHEVRNDYNAHGSGGSLVAAATANVAAMGLFRKESYGASKEEVAKRCNYYKSHPYRDSRVSEAFLSRELKRARMLGEYFWVHFDYLEDYTLHGAKGTMWSAGDAASASTASAMRFRAKPDEIQLREAFYNKYWWKSSKYRLDFLQNGFSAELWTKTASNGNGDLVTESEMLERMCYYASAGLETERRFEEFNLFWWKSPSSIAHYMLHADESKYIKAATPQVALSESHNNNDMTASSSAMSARNHYMIVVTPTDAAEDITDTQIMSGVKSVNDTWWKNAAYQRLYDSQRPLEHWKDVESITDYLENSEKGRKWSISGPIFPANMNESCSKEEKKERVAYYATSFWKSSKYQNDYEEHGLKGTFWTSTKPNASGKPVSEVELNARKTYFQPTAIWQLAMDPGIVSKSTWCGMHEDFQRSKWFQDHWWKCVFHSESPLIRDANLNVFLSHSRDLQDLQANEDEVKKRVTYFDGMGAIEWWQNPVIIADFQKGAEGCMWNAHTFKDALLSMGLESPADPVELECRTRWYKKNAWRSAEMVKDYAAGGNKWKSTDSGNHNLREEWMKVHKTVSKEEETRRKEWFNHQLSDEQLQVRREWLLRRSQEARRIHTSELGDLLAQLNDGVRPSDDEVQAIEDAIRAERKDPSSIEGITQQEFLRAMAATQFYIGSTEEEKMRSEQEALEALQKEEMDRLEEEAAHLAQEAQEELEAAGEEYVPFDEAADEEEQEYLNALEEEENARLNQNEDDMELQDDAWEETVEEVNDEEIVDDYHEDTKERQRVMEEAFASNEYGGDVGEEDSEVAEGDLDEDAKEALEDVVNKEGWDDEENADWDEAQKDAKNDAHTNTLQDFHFPLPKLTNPQYLKAFFTIMKYTPSTSLVSSSRKRIWVVDHFTRCFYNLSKNNRIRKEHPANMLIQLEKNIIDGTRLRMLFFDAPHSYDFQFVSVDERERFYETASAIRSTVRCYAPDLVGPGSDGTDCAVTSINGTGENAVSVVCNDITGKPVKRQLVGECRVNVSKSLTEPVSIWCGTFNLGGHRPPKRPDALQNWMPKGKYDIYAVSAQEASYRQEESEWFDYIQNYLGDDYLPLASMFVFDTLLIVLTKKKNLLKITSTEGSTRGTVHKSVCGGKGGIGISIQYLETSLCFCTCHLAARTERSALRNSILEEIVENLQLGVRDTDISSQFHHVFFFGDFNYRTELDAATADSLLQAKKYEELLAFDQFNNQRLSEGILHGFQEPSITFAPTYRLGVGSKEYVEKNSPSYCDRVLHKSLINAPIKCTGYSSDPDILLSEHRPVSATFLVQCIRPVLSCFMKTQKPVPEFIFEQIFLKDYTGEIIKKPMLLIHTRFSSSCQPLSAEETSTVSPTWKKDTIPHLISVTQAQEYLEMCYILLIVQEGHEKRETKKHRGTGVIPLKGCVIGKSGTSITFESVLLFRGKPFGKICGSFTWQGIKRESSKTVAE